MKEKMIDIIVDLELEYNKVLSVLWSCVKI